MTINPYLIARLYVLQEAFAHPGYIGSISSAPKTTAKPDPFNWEDLLKKGEDDQGGGGGGGTIKGLRGKNHQNGKAAAIAQMKRLGRK